jgi:phosphoserine phosphatase
MKFKIAVFDMDGVFVDVNSSWAYVHQKFGVDNADNLNLYLNGEIDYRELLKRDAKLWGRRHISELKTILNELKLIECSEHTIFELRKRGYKIVLLSAGVYFLAEIINEVMHFDRFYANKVCFDENGYLNGRVEPMVELLKKDVILKKILFDLKIKPEECVAIGDSEYEIPVFNLVGLSIAFNTKSEKVKDSVEIVVENKDLREVLKYLD